MRVTNTSTYRNYTSSINSVHANLNKSMNKISSGRQFETAAESPLSYYRGKEIDNQYLEALGKVTLLTDVKSRLEQQEKGAYDIQQLLSKAKNEVVLKARTATSDVTARDTLQSDLIQKAQSMVNDLRTQYQDYYVFGGNDSSTPPFSLDTSDPAKISLTFSHKFPGESTATDFKMTLGKDPADPNRYLFQLDDPTQTEKLVQAMAEQGYMDLGYGDIRSRDTLLDTYTGGMNLLTGLNSDMVKSRYYDASGNLVTNLTDPLTPGYATPEAEIMKQLTDGPLGTVAQAITALEEYFDSGDPDALDDQLERLITDMTEAEHVVSTVYSDLGNKYNALDNTEDRLNTLTDSLKVQYKDIVGADPFESIYEMFNYQYAFNAALQVGSNLMQSSLFDFVR